MFCMLLRKHLTGARLLALEQPALERLFILRFACLDELGTAVEKQLVVEMMGRSSNLALVDGNGRVLDCLRRADAISSPRPLLPGLFYELPPAQQKEHLLLCSRERFLERFAETAAGAPADRWLLDTFSGVSPLLARELSVRGTGSCDVRLTGGEGERLWDALQALLQAPARPVLLWGEGPKDLYCRSLQQYGGALEQREAESFSALLDTYFTERERLARQQQRSQALTRLVKTRRERAARKLAARIAERAATAQRETWRQWGDIIKANLYRMSRGADALEAENFYDPDMAQVTIPLDPRLSPQQNAAHYYKRYSKAKTAEKVLGEQIGQAEGELAYLESVLEELSRAGGEKDLLEIRRELVSQGYLQETDKRRMKAPAPQPLRFRTPGGALILVGKNNLQNDWLTLKRADKSSVWLHTQKVHGSHVIADCSLEDRETLRYAAVLAAAYSQARDSAKVAVDYTLARYVRKPAGARPGMVIYTDQRTLFVTPDAETLGRLEQLK